MNKTTHNEKDALKVVEQFNHLNASRAPISDFLPIVDPENLIITLRGSDIVFKGIAGFADHQIGKLIYFDQKFECELIKSETQRDHITLSTKGGWYAKIWQSPAAYSQQLIADLSHTWILKKSKQSTYIIVTHICEHFKYRDGFSPRDGVEDFHLNLK
ncbi:hypothetical protein LEAN103870_18455 [Legionella anisa]|uniref:Uncharacterized protein n=1 Tax=Legionella anisa TaxID=28082 RepID=A0AAX0WRM5_9GAMM|nr:hypothetical protein [Legionella anisa]AWN74906.1 hypothetical protein DLD14_14265 [Legionella anisa]KTC67382.1 hypothetical protein Lani_3727 [Legionella anisa]MBN5937657.1 hypothetical protein [Legionella anisa]MCW8424891.1 hypothetical protein [Legionella anisa]MCW8445989.1 hypothetical protein [Legionella anisa]